MRPNITSPASRASSSPSRSAPLALVAATILLAVAGITAGGAAAVTLPPGNSAQQWNTIAQDTIVNTSGMFQNEALLYMSYTQAAVYDAVTSIEGGYEPYGPSIKAPRHVSADAAVVEAAYRTLSQSFPAQAATLDALHAQALALVPDGRAKDNGIAVGTTAAADIIALRNGDGRQPVGTLTPYAPPASAGLAFWEPTPPALLPPQTPWLKDVRPFVINSANEFLPGPPPALDTRKWVHEYNEIKLWGRATGSPRTQEQTDIAMFWTTNVVRQYNTAFRDLATSHTLTLLETARLLAMGNIVGADTQIACWSAKYHYGFWRPVTAIAEPGRDDGNPSTMKDPVWTPTVVTPNHPEYPAAHGCLTSAMAEVLTEFLGTKRIDVTLSSTTVATMPTRHFERARDLREEIIEARLWGGMHYRDSSIKGVALGRDVARYVLRHAFQPTDM
jgi:PAP2 superfamily